METVLNFIRGICMAAADSVPGVSGGTVAFIMGFYDKFINSLNNIVSRNKEERLGAIIFLVKLMLGWAVGMGISVVILGSLFESHIYQLCSLFLGLTAAALPVIMKAENKHIEGNYRNLIFTLIGCFIVCLITWLDTFSVSGMGVDKLSITNGIYIFVSAMIAISAMVLPGISGLTLLLILGLYVPVINAVKGILTFDFSGLGLLIIFGLGVLCGIVAVIKIVKNALEKHRSQMIYFILGLMLGSFYAIVKGPTTLDIPHSAMNIHTFNPVFFLIGAAIIYGLEAFKIFSTEKREEDHEIIKKQSN